MQFATAEELDARRAVIATSPELSALATALRRRLEPLLERAPAIPVLKPLLTRHGFACPADGARLVFDPFAAGQHRCGRCRRVYTGEAHERAWVWRYYLWLCERAIHLALLSRLLPDDGLAAAARELLHRFARVYFALPNRDNVLGPTRMFFSTYLEAIWLTQFIIAASLLESPPAEVVDAVAEEASGLVGSFDEGWSNRQVWNNCALLAAGGWLNDRARVAQALDGEHGLIAQLEHCVSREGLWFEGENYHFFALRGFLLGAEWARVLGCDLYADPRAGQPLRAMFRAPLLTVLPDLTLPARGDAPYGVSLLQPRFAELWEIGWARTGDARLAGLLAELYATPAPAPTPEADLYEIAEQEQHRPPSMLDRSRLGWKTLLWARPDRPAAASWRSGTEVLQDAGLVVLRPRPGCYLSVACGRRAKRGQTGHLHPDLLHLSLYDGEPVLADFGTGSYVSPSLFWYRSTLAHNAPAPDDGDQHGGDAWCLALDARDQWSWCQVVAEGILGAESRVVRTCVIGPRYVVDVVDVVALPPDGVAVLAVHALGMVVAHASAEAAVPRGAVAGDPESWVRLSDSPARWPSAFSGRETVLVPRAGEEVFACWAPGPPAPDFADGEPVPFLVRRAAGPGRWIQVYAGTGDGLEAGVAETEVLVGRAGRWDRLAIGDGDLTVRPFGGAPLVLGGRRERPARPAQVGWRGAVASRLQGICLSCAPSPEDWQRHIPASYVVPLGSAHYRRSEAPYAERQIRADLAVFAVGAQLGFAVRVHKPALVFRPEAPAEPLDNEPPQINSDGLQCYHGDPWAGYLLVPVAGESAVKVVPVPGTAARPGAVRARWAPVEGGYSIVALVETGRVIVPGDRVPVAVTVNEMDGDRERRAGQLALGGGGWVYLRGAREDRDTAVLVDFV